MRSLIPWLRSRGVFKQINLQKVRNDFGLWLPRINPSWHWRWAHLVYTREHLDRVTSGEIERLAKVRGAVQGSLAAIDGARKGITTIARYGDGVPKAVWVEILHHTAIIQKRANKARETLAATGLHR